MARNQAWSPRIYCWLGVLSRPWGRSFPGCQSPRRRTSGPPWWRCTVAPRPWTRSSQSTWSSTCSWAGCKHLPASLVQESVPRPVCPTGRTSLSTPGPLASVCRTSRVPRSRLVWRMLGFPVISPVCRYTRLKWRVARQVLVNRRWRPTSNLVPRFFSNGVGKIALVRGDARKTSLTSAFVAMVVQFSESRDNISPRVQAPGSLCTPYVASTHLTNLSVSIDSKCCRVSRVISVNTSYETLHSNSS